jgi:hypothetical protein
MRGMAHGRPHIWTPDLLDDRFNSAFKHETGTRIIHDGD